MTSNRPYLIRAIYEWIVDNGLTPHLLVFAEHPGVVVPTEYVDEGKIVLNISPTAIRGLNMENEEITFSGRFGGRPMNIIVPTVATTAIYAKENGKGMVFGSDQNPDDDNPTPPKGSSNNDDEKAPPSRSHLKVVK